jgi:hypothetical protein
MNAESLSRRNRHIAAAALLTAAGACWHTLAHAEICVGTSAELEAALAGYAQPDLGNTYTIRVRTGTYTLSHQFSQYAEPQDGGRRLELLGGHNADCSARTNDPFYTVIHGATNPAFLFLSPRSGALIQSIRFTGGFELDFDHAADCVHNGADVIIQNTVIEGGPNDVLRLYPACFDVRIENSLIVGGVFGSNSDNIDVFNDGDGDRASIIDLVNNTIVNANQNGLNIFNTAGDGNLSFHLYNNVFWNNGTDGVHVGADSDAVAIRAYNNQWDSFNGALTAGSANSTANPQLTGAFRPSEPGSPLINSGNDNPVGGLPSIDLNGLPRHTGSAVDRGAYESAVDDAYELVVTNDNDSGAGSLRQAILNANADPGLNKIRFAVSVSGSSCVLFIPNSPYPDVLDDLNIDGYTQANSSRNTLDHGNNSKICVWIVKGGDRLSHAFRVPAAAGAHVSLSLDGVAIGGFDNAVLLQGGDHHGIRGSHFGPGLGSGFIDVPLNGTHIRLDGTTLSAIGGSDAGARNVFAGADGAAIFVEQNSDSHLITNNYIGTLPDGAPGSAVMSNGFGVVIESAGISLTHNVIAASGSHGVFVLLDSAHDNLIASNRIGLREIYGCILCSYALGNAGNGVFIELGAHDNAVTGNIIAYNAKNGVQVVDDSLGNALRGNMIYSNSGLGIELGGDGPDTIDNDVSDFALHPPPPNHGQNFPLLSKAIGGRRSGWLTGKLSSVNGSYKIDVHSNSSCDASGQGEGVAYHGAFSTTVSNETVLPPRNGTGQFNVRVLGVPGAANLADRFITLTATNANGDTSEFSACTAYVCDQIFAQAFDNNLADSCPAP